MKMSIQIKNKFDIRTQHDFTVLIHVSFVEIPMEKNFPRKWAWPIPNPLKKFY